MALDSGQGKDHENKLMDLEDLDSGKGPIDCLSDMSYNRYNYAMPFKNSEYKLATDKLKERLAMLHTSKDRHSSKENEKNIGVLAKLLEMPIDIFCEISTYLEPYDLLNLARSTRTLNGFLMSRESRPIWRMARTYYPGFPECPSDLSEPAYARLLFETECCHACLEPRNTRPYFALRARLCYICCTTTVIKGYQLITRITDLQGVFLQCVPCLVSPLLNHRPLSQEEFYIERAKAVAAKFYARYPEMRKEDDYFVKRRAYVEFVEENKISMDAILKHVAEVDQWLVTYRQMKMMEANSAASRHKLRLQNKLVEIGYCPEDFPGDWDAEWEEIMDNPQCFSPDSSDSVFKTLEACIAREKERREADERDIRRSMREDEVTSFISSLKMPPWMNRVDILQLPTIEEMIQQNDFSIPIAVKDWEMATPRILQEIDSYALEIQRRLCELMLAKMSETKSFETVPRNKLENPIDSLNDSTSFFRCSCCSVSLLRYPSLLNHNNYSSTKVVVTQRLKFDDDATSIAKSLLAYLSHKPDKINEAVFQCLRCQDHLIPPLSWDELVYHFVVKQYEYSKANAKWRLKPFTEDLYDDHALTGPTPIALLTKSQAEVLSSKTAGKKLIKVRLPF